MLTLGQNVERYTVESIIGQGGMAVVYRVRHNQLGSFHALKILTVPKPNIRERLLQEGRAQAVIRHPNVVSVSDVLEVAGSPALLMEYIEGPTLEAWLERESPTLAVAEELFRGICAGVGEAHVHGLVHRDLKPSNVLLAPRASTDPSQGFIPKVTDFGIAKVIASDEKDGSTRTNVAMGTPHYMAPEQIRDAKSVDPRADVFSLGCILYELICGARPFDGADVLTVLNAVASGRYLSPRSHVPDLPDRVMRAIEGALIVDRTQRIQSCGALTAILAGQDPAVAHATWPPPTTSSDLRAPVPRSGGDPPNEAPAPADRGPAKERDTLSERVREDAAADGDVDSRRVSSETPSMPIDPNAMTVPRPQQRVETPSWPSGSHGVSARGLGVVLAVLAIVVAVGGVALFSYSQSLASSDPAAIPDDGALFGITHPDPSLMIEPPPDVADPEAPPTVRTDPKNPPVSSVATDPTGEEDKRDRGLGLFAPKPPPPVGDTGQIVVIGENVKTHLYPHGVRSKPIPTHGLAPGRYDLEVANGGKPPPRLEIEVRAGEVVRVECTQKACILKP